MATLVKVGENDADNLGDYGNRLVFTLTNGNVLVVIHDHNGTGLDRLFFYESADRVNWVLKETAIMPAGDSLNITGTVKANNDLIICRMSSDSTNIQSLTYDYSAHTAGAWGNVASTAAGITFGRYDVDVSDEGIIYVAAIYAGPAGGDYGWALYTKPTGNPWVVAITKLHSDIHAVGAESISLCSGTKAGALQNVAVAVGFSQAKIDKGIRFYQCQVNTTSGAITNSITMLKGTYGAGSADGNSAWPEGRLVRLFRDSSDADKVVFAAMHAERSRDILVGKASFAQGLKFTVPMVKVHADVSSGSIWSRYMGIVSAAGVVNFLFGARVTGIPNKTIANYTAVVNGGVYDVSARSMRFLSGGYIGGRDVSVVYSSGQRDGGQNFGDIVIQTKVANNNRKWYHEYSTVTGSPNTPAPADTSTVVDSHPKITAKLKSGKKYAQVRYALQVQIATNSSFTTGLVSLTGTDFEIVDGSNVNAGTVAIAQVSASNTLVPNVTYYLRLRNADEFGKYGAWSVATTFQISHPPTISNMTPSGGANLAYGTSGSVDYSWTATDPSDGDFQTAYQLQVVRQDTGALLVDTGKVASTNTFVTGTTDASYKGIQLGWRVRAWDSFDDVGPWSGYQSYYLWNGPTFSAITPAPDAVVTSPVPHVTFTINTDAGAAISDWQVVVSEGNKIILNKSRPGTGTDPSGTSYTVNGDGNLFHNDHHYTITISATDSRKIKTINPPYSITCEFTPPPAPTTQPVADVTHYNVENEGYVSVTWDSAGQDPSYVSYTVCRRDDLIDPYTQQVITVGDWRDLGEVYGTSATYEYHDLLAPSNYKVVYAVKQNVAAYGDIVDSERGNEVACYPATDGYWLVDPDFGGDSLNTIKLWNVTADSYTEEYERAEYFVIGRGMHSDVGERMGFNGSLSANLRNSGGTTARAKKLVLESIRDQQRNLYLRNPFGDVFPVSTGDIQVERLAGFDRQEFCNVTIPYQEVGT